ncbi:MAG: 50S ribosomal protein L13 [Candidatus Ryanbacteria bacterium]|nr:50S ribosomal protein L13 [Candidatus Ryanbacteria bacterium]
MEKQAAILDAKGKSLGRIASEAALWLRGKRDPKFLPYKKPEQKVIIKNAAAVRITGRKLKDEARERYSGFPGGLKSIPYERVFTKDPSKLVRQAVAGMIPRNKLKRDILKNLTIYAGDQN